MKNKFFAIILIFALALCACDLSFFPGLQNKPSAPEKPTEPEVNPNTGEARIRYIIADIQLGGPEEYYQGFPDDPDVVEALSRWDAGVRATNINSFQRVNNDNGWQVVYSGTNNTINGMDVTLSTASADTTQITGEARIRYIIADIQLGGPVGYYQDFPNDPDVVEALSRWDAGVRVVNIDLFQRVDNGEGWQIVYSGTNSIINGMDVVLSTNNDLGSTLTRLADGMVMIAIPSGLFTMGDTLGEAMTECGIFLNNCQESWFTDEQPVHEVYLDTYLIDKTEVTNAMYSLCVQAGACKAPGHSYDNAAYANHPVIYVDWYDAQTYCEWADARLPSEAEWEKAARGTDGRLFPWGNEQPNSEIVNYNENVGGTKDIGSYPFGASPYGALDMAGNVWEWVNDWYDAGYYSISPENNPLGPSSGTQKILRGGSFVVNDFDVRIVGRAPYNPTDIYDNVGFRCARTAP